MRLKLVREAYEASKKTYGYRRIELWLRQKRGLSINHTAVLRLMNRLGIHSVVCQHKFYRCKPPGGALHHYGNVLNRDFSATGANQKWVTVVTYIATQQGWAYPSTIKDLFGAFIMAYALSLTNSVGLVLKTLRLAQQGFLLYNQM